MDWRWDRPSWNKNIEVASSHPSGTVQSGLICLRRGIYDMLRTKIADDKLRVEIAKVIAETSKINSERFWIPFTVLSVIIVTVAKAINPLT